FSYSSLESTRKIYIIEDAQTLTNQAANRLLKFLEEPLIETTAILLTDNIQAIIPTIRSRCHIIDLNPLNKYKLQREMMNTKQSPNSLLKFVEEPLIETTSILLTDNIQSIIPTIRSRCQIIDLKPLNTDKLQREMMNANLSEQQSRLMSAITYNIDEAIELDEDEKYKKIIELSKNMIKTIVSNYENRFIYLHQNWLQEITDRQDTEYGLDLLLLGFKDITYMQIGKEESLALFNSTDQILN